MSSAAAQAEQTASQAQARSSLRGCVRDTFHRVVAANRAQLAALSRQRAGPEHPRIASPRPYTRDVAQMLPMYGYARSSAAAARTPFSSPPQTTSPAAAASQGGAVAQATASSAGTGAQSTLRSGLHPPQHLESTRVAAICTSSIPLRPIEYAPQDRGFLNLLSVRPSRLRSFITSDFRTGFSRQLAQSASINPL